MKWFNKVKTQLSEKVRLKASEMYEKASPKVQKEIDKVIATKAEDLIKAGTKVLGIGMIIIFAIRAVNSPSESIKEIAETANRVINVHYDEVNITYNYYSKED